MTLIPNAGLLGGNPTEGQFKLLIEQLRNFTSEMIGGSEEVTLTIASGSITPVTALLAVDTEAGASSDDLDNLLQPATQHDGKVVTLHSVDAARIVTVRHARGGAGQMLLSDNRDFVLDNTSKRLVLQRNGLNWVEAGRFAMNEFLRETILKTSDYTVTSDDNGKGVLVDATSGVVNITLPSPSSVGDGFRLVLKKIDSSANAVNVVGSIDGGNPKILAALFESIVVFTDGVSWHIVGETGVGT
ncbi:MAG: hypothetical protein JKX85_01310 [Phycisphaeraceae bacterium]|nr:hypothetical protein [Phycisphaeraceae bacterium]